MDEALFDFDSHGRAASKPLDTAVANGVARGELRSTKFGRRVLVNADDVNAQAQRGWRGGSVMKYVPMTAEDAYAEACRAAARLPRIFEARQAPHDGARLGSVAHGPRGFGA